MDRLLNRVAQTVAGAQDLEALTRSLLELLQLVTGMESTYLTRVDEDEGVQHVLFARNSHTMQIPEGLVVPWHDTLCKRALEEGRPYTNDVAGCWGDSEAARQLGLQTYLSQPVFHLDGTLYGTLCAASAESRAVADNNLRVLTLFAELIAHQIERERTLEDLRVANHELSLHAWIDPLTGIANRRAILRTLRQMLAHARREAETVQVAFIDLDGFKAINDTHGHEAGDRFLMHIAGRLTAGVRTSDIVGRYGGDEFVVLTVGAQESELKQRLEQLTRGHYEGENLSLDYAGASVGVVSSTPEEVDPERLLSRADAVMYGIKKARKAARLPA